MPLAPAYRYSNLQTLMVDVGLDAIPFLRDAIARTETFVTALTACQPVGDVAIGCSMVVAFAAKKHKALARHWMLRHPEHAKAACHVVAETKGASAKDRAAAARALRYLDPADASLDGHLKPSKDKPLPAYLDVNKLPEVKDRDRLIAALAHSTADEPAPVVARARTHKNIAALSWSLFQTWLDAGAPNKEAWCLHAVGFWGTDDEANALLPYIEQWPQQQATARVKLALDALLNIGTDNSLAHLGNLRFYARESGTRSGAAERVHEIGLRLGLTPDEVEERIALDYGAAATSVIDYGERKFAVTFDDDLRPVAVADDGTRYFKLPNARKDEDKARVGAEKKRFAVLVKALEPQRVPTLGRIERLADSGRLIPQAVWVRAYGQHPWLSALAARLPWETSGDGVRLLEATPRGDDE